MGLYIAAPWLSVSVFDEPTLDGPLRILSISVITGVGVTLLRAVIQAQEEIQKIVVLDTVRSVGKVLVAVLIFLGVQTAAGAAWAVLAASAMGATVAGNYVQYLDIRLSFQIKEIEFWRVLGYSAPLVIVGFSYFLAQKADRLMLGWLGDAEEVEVYTAASTLASANINAPGIIAK